MSKRRPFQEYWVVYSVIGSRFGTGEADGVGFVVGARSAEKAKRKVDWMLQNEREGLEQYRDNLYHEATLRVIGDGELAEGDSDYIFDFDQSAIYKLCDVWIMDEWAIKHIEGVTKSEKEDKVGKAMVPSVSTPAANGSTKTKPKSYIDFDFPFDEAQLTKLGRDHLFYDNWNRAIV